MSSQNTLSAPLLSESSQRRAARRDTASRTTGVSRVRDYNNSMEWPVLQTSRPKIAREMTALVELPCLHCLQSFGMSHGGLRFRPRCSDVHGCKTNPSCSKGAVVGQVAAWRNRENASNFGLGRDVALTSNEVDVFMYLIVAVAARPRCAAQRVEPDGGNALAADLVSGVRLLVPRPELQAYRIHAHVRLEKPVVVGMQPRAARRLQLCAAVGQAL